MSRIALFIRHKTRSGMRAEVQQVWLRHMGPIVSRNPGHEAYFYCFDNGDPDGICAFQMYGDTESASAFLKTDGYLAYLAEVEPLLSGQPEVTMMTPMWVKDE